MSARLISGPDLGAGYLYQLSFDPEPPGPAFVFHAQDGGADAAGPPIGPLDFLGYRHPETPCQFGGPRCWERRFSLPETALVRARATYQRTRFCMAAMLGHAYEGTPVPAAAGLEEFLQRCDGPLRAAEVPYRIVGKGVGWLRGQAEPPAALLVEVADGGADRIGAALEPLLLEPVADRGPEEGHGGRAFLGTFKAGLRVDFGEPPPGAGGGGLPADTVPFAGFAVPIASSAGRRVA